MMRQTAVVICPGRGVYGRDELGYLQRHHASKTTLLDAVDQVRRSHGRDSVRALDAQDRYAPARHAASEHASALIYACALGDAEDIDLERFEIVAVCGNSLGWYLSLAVGQALGLADGARLVDTTGGLMARDGEGGQIVYPLVDAEWRSDARRAEVVALALEAGNAAGKLYLSIRLGGMAVLAGDEAGLRAAEQVLAPTPQDRADGRYPMRLVRHAAFHTPLVAPVADAARRHIGPDLFTAPRVPLIDGRGQVWRPHTSAPDALHAYTLGAQITQTYDFTQSIKVAVTEFAPDRLIVLGPGSSLTPAVAQVLIALKWRGLADKASFSAAQNDDPFVLAMGRDAQRALVMAE